MSQGLSANNPQTPAQRIKEARERRGLTQAKLASLMGVTRPLIAQWETEVRHPSIATLHRLSGVLSTSYGWLAFGDETAPLMGLNPEIKFNLDPDLLKLTEEVVREAVARKGLDDEWGGFYPLVAVIYAVALEMKDGASTRSMDDLREDLIESALIQIGA